ncbi:transposase, partial [Desulfurococcus sp.]
MQENSLKTVELVRMYSVPINDARVRELITWYVNTLQRAVDIIWGNIEWRYEFPRITRNGKVKLGKKIRIPVLPKSNSFKKILRDELLKDCPYAKHWVDAVIRTAYSIMESWRKRYVKGRARKAKPRIKRRFARCKITLMKVDYAGKRVRITLKPGEYLDVSWASKWFSGRVDGWSVGEVILKDDRVLIPFKTVKMIKVERVIGWDSNELSLDGYEPSIGFIHVNLRYLQSLKIVYEKKKATAQSIGRRDLFGKYARRERNRERDFINKLVSQLVKQFPNTIHVFEDLEKSSLVEKPKVKSKTRRKRNARTPWRTIHRKLSEKAITSSVSPKNTSRTCPRCGYVVKTQVGHVFKCPRCRLEIDRQEVASINIRSRYLRMWGFPRTNEPEFSVRAEVWVGVAPNGWRPMIWRAMMESPPEADEA